MKLRCAVEGNAELKSRIEETEKNRLDTAIEKTELRANPVSLRLCALCAWRLRS